MEVKRSSLSKQDSSFEDPFSVHPWDSLITKLCHEFSVEDSDFDNFLRSSKFRIGDDNYSRIQRLDGRTGRKYHAFFDCLEKKFNGKDETVEFLINLTASLNFHGDSGSVPFTKVFEQYKQESAKYHRQFTAKGLEPDPNFVGRVELSSKIIEILQKRPDEIGLSSERHPIGVVLCGLPGMGKTSLASQICYIMRFGSNVVRNWNIIVVNQRDKREVGELLADLIYSIGKDMGNDDFVCEFNSVTCQREKVMSLLKDLGERKGDYLVLLDNMDGHFNPEHSPCEEFLTEIFDTIAKVDNIKVVMTVCKSVSKSNASNLFGGKSAFRGHVIEFKLTGLSYEDAEQIMTKISRRVDQHKLDPRLCRQAFDACDGNPMGIKALSVLLRDPYNDDFVRSSFKTGELFNVMSCLKQSFAKTIPECLQRFIARLFVFNTNWFSVKDAQYVSQNETYVSQRYCAETIKELQRHHILERDFFSKMRQKSEKQDERSCEQEKRFAFHSIVAEFLSQTCKESACFKQEYIDGRKAFLSYFCKRIEKSGRKMNARNPLEIKELLEELKPHLSLFFKLILEEKESLCSLLNKGKLPLTIRCSYIWDVSEFTNAQYLKMMFAKRQAQLAEKAKELMQFIYWKSTEATCLMKSDKLNIALEYMDNIKGQFEITDAGQLAYSADGWNVEKADEAFAFYTFYKIYGTIYLRMGTKENNKDKLNIALVKFGKAMDIIHSERSKKLKKVFKSDIAIIQNLHGCVYFSIGDLTNALECHKSAKVSDCTRPGFVSQRFEFAANIAACYQQMGLNTKIENDRMKHLSYALKECDNCIGLNKQIGMQHSTTSLTILRNRADVFYVKGELERALTDENNVLNIARQLYVSPHVDITVAIERAACYHFKLGKRLRDEDGEIGTDLMQKGLQLYEDMLFEICNGGLLPFENNDDRVIFSELEELIKNRHDPAQPNIDRSVYIEALDHIKNGDSSMCDGPNRIAYQHLIEWLRNRRMQLRTNKQYRNAKDNHIKLMEKLGLSKKAIEKTKHKYQQDFELGKFNKLINKKQSYVPDYEEQERVRQAIAAGAEIILDPNQKDMHQIERAFGGIDCCLDSGSFDNHDQDPSTSDNKEDRDIEHMLVGKRRDLRRQRSIDGSSDVLNSIVAEGEVKLRNLSTSRSSRSSLGSLKRKSSSVSSSGSFTEPWLKTSSFSSQTSQGESSFDNDIIEYDEDELRARDCDQKRQSWANAGKQESISSELSKLQVLDDEFEPVPKQLKVEETDDK